MLRALWMISYGDRHVLLNAWRAMRRRPARLLLWGLYTLGILAVMAGKIAFPRTTSATPQTVVLDDLWVCGFAIAFGIVLTGGASRWVGAFANRAEASFLAAADAPGTLIAGYLQARAVVRLLVRGFGQFMYPLVFVMPFGTTPRAFGALFAFFAASAIAIASLVLPRALVRGIPRIAAGALGVVVIVAAVVTLLADALRFIPAADAHRLARLIPVAHPGIVLTRLAAGDLTPIAGAVLVAIVSGAAFARAARAGFPELYALSVAIFEARAVRLARFHGTAAAAPRRTAFGAATGTPRIARGALAFVWIDALMFARNVSPLRSGALALGALLAGGALALAARYATWLSTMVVYWIPGYAFAISTLITVRLARTMRMPIFWLGGAPLSARLGAWAFGPFARESALFALAAFGYAAVSRVPQQPLLAFAGAVSVLALGRGVGLAVFAMFPNPLDQAGPATMIRALVTLVLLAPAGIAGVVGGIFSPAAAVLAASGTAWTEAFALTLYAGSALTGSVDRLTVR